jgi:uncharacterized membrane protein
LYWSKPKDIWRIKNKIFVETIIVSNILPLIIDYNERNKDKAIISIIIGCLENIYNIQINQNAKRESRIDFQVLNTIFIIGWWIWLLLDRFYKAINDKLVRDTCII